MKGGGYDSWVGQVGRRVRQSGRGFTNKIGTCGGVWGAVVLDCWVQ